LIRLSAIRLPPASWARRVGGISAPTIQRSGKMIPMKNRSQCPRRIVWIPRTMNRAM
jgi:hypothetical protein